MKVPRLVELSPRGIRLLELTIVLGVAFLAAGIGSLYVLFTGRLLYPSTGVTSWRVAVALLYELMALGLLAYVLYRQGRSLSDLGIGLARRDIPWSLALLVLGVVAAALCYVLVPGWHAIRTGSSPRGINPLAGLTLSIPAVAWILINPFFEELIVRAYTMTEVLGLTGSGALAVLVSVGVQTLYHLYQGVPLALAHGATFLVFSLYYLKTRRIAPVVLAHLYMDAGAFALWLLRPAA